MKRQLEPFFLANPGLRTTVEDAWEDGDVVMARLTWGGTLGSDWVDPHLGRISGTAGKSVKIRGMAIRRFENGRIVELWDSMDAYSLLRQIGALS